MNPVDQVLHQQVRAVQASCQLAQRNIASAEHIADVVRHARVNVHPQLRSLTRRETYQMQVAGERRAEVILGKQLQQLESLSGDEFTKRIGWLRAYEWRHLSGNYPRLAQHANRDALRLTSRARSADNRWSDSAASPLNA